MIYDMYGSNTHPPPNLTVCLKIFPYHSIQSYFTL